MNYDDFITRFGEPLTTQEGTILFETFGEDYERIKAADPNCVWTVIEEDGKLYLAPTLRFVNRLKYVIAQSHAAARMIISGFAMEVINLFVQLLSIQFS